MANETEPRALGAALSAPAFVTRGHGAAMHAADRHVERWAPETGANRVRSMRSLGFVDRLVAPWIETAQRSASLRLFSQYAQAGLGEREGGAVSWVFPRPWYQDELDWMAAARQVAPDAAGPGAPSLLTTRGTYVPRAQSARSAQTSAGGAIAAPPVVMPSALYEYVAPSLSIAARRPPPIPGVGFGGDTLPRGEAYSPLISLAAVQAADLMTRAVAPLAAPRGPSLATTAMTPGLRAVLTSILSRAAAERAPARISALAPELVTPPSPRPSHEAPAAMLAPASEDASGAEAAMQVAAQYAAQRTRIAELQRIAQHAALREIAARAGGVAPAGAPGAEARPAADDARTGRAATPAIQAAQVAEVRAAAERVESELRQRTAAGRAAEAQGRADASLSAAERARAELAQATAAGRTTEAQRQADALAAAAAERARIEERVAQRLAERTSAQRLHDHARTEAAAHARAGADAAAVSAIPAVPAAPPRAPAEVTAAIAGLPPELAAMLAPLVAQRPERAMQAIQELHETLRTVELLARGSAAGTAFEATRGPRLVMPAGLGGLVSAVDRAQSMTEHRAMLGGQRPLAPLPQFAVSPQAQDLAARPAAASRDVRVPTLSWLSAGPRPQSIAPTTALGATATASPAALSHVAWADRWLARFAGAGPQSLDAISAAGAAAPAARMQALLHGAPGAVFVAPELLRGDLTAGADRAEDLPRSGAPTAATTSAPPAARSGSAAGGELAGLRLINPASSEPLRRFDDDGETPDDVFAAIAAAASRGRATARPAAQGAAAAAAPTAPAAAQLQGADRPVLADLVAHAAPSAPGAGLSAQLASSPFAPALRHVLSLPSVASFDVRSLFGADLGATYLAGLIGRASRELEIGVQSVPAWATWSEAPLAMPIADRPGLPERIDRLVPGFDAAYVSPEVSPAWSPAGVAEGAGLPGSAAAGAADTAASPTADVAGRPALGEHAAGLTTLRTSLLSWDLRAMSELAAPPLGATSSITGLSIAGSGAVPVGFAPAGQSTSAARRMVEAMSLPMLGESAPDPSSTWAAPGMLAERAQSWSVAQERSASDLALDFVAPELVLAARVYGLGPAQAAQAARLAVAGPGQLGAMASAVDRTFIEAMSIGREARLEAERYQRVAAVAARASADLGAVAGAPGPAAAASPAAPGVPGVPSSSPANEARAAITTAFPTADGAIAAAMAPAGYAVPGTRAFGVDRRTPRGAFLWPSATVAALGMTAASPDGSLSMSVAALELLAAQVVAEIGTYTALSDADAATLGLAGEGGALAAGSGRRAAGADAGEPEPSRSARMAAASPAALTAARARDAGSAAAGPEPAEAEVLGAAAALVPSARRARFDALFVALSQSTAGVHWSPAARAARALALAGRGEDGPISGRERAATAWDVLPVVYAGDSGASDAAASAAATTSGATSAAALASAAVAQALASHVAPSWLGGPRAAGPGAAAGGRASGGRGSRPAGSRDLVAGISGDAGSADGLGYVSGPGLGALSARAGEALGSYVTPVAPPAAPRERPSETTSVGAVLRPPTAAPEYVQTGRSGGRYGGGEVEIPPWFEAAARKMLADRSDNADGISFAELTLVSAAPASHIAASTRSAPSASPPAPSTGPATQQSNTPQIDIEKLANEVYRNILVLMDVARARNGDPYL